MLYIIIYTILAPFLCQVCSKTICFCFCSHQQKHLETNSFVIACSSGPRSPSVIFKTWLALNASLSATSKIKNLRKLLVSRIFFCYIVDATMESCQTLHTSEFYRCNIIRTLPLLPLFSRVVGHGEGQGH